MTREVLLDRGVSNGSEKRGSRPSGVVAGDTSVSDIIFDSTGGFFFFLRFLFKESLYFIYTLGANYMTGWIVQSQRLDYGHYLP